jgi:hypothetical protein
MDLYNKTQKPKNSKAKAVSLLALISGALLFLMGGSEFFVFPAIFQLIGISLITASIYIASAFLLRELSFSVVKNNKECENFSENYDLIVRETRGKRQIKLCHFEISQISFVRIVDEQNKKQINTERKNMTRYTYDSEFLSQKQIEIRAFLDGDNHSLLIAYDEELFELLKRLTKSAEK